MCPFINLVQLFPDIIGSHQCFLRAAYPFISSRRIVGRYYTVQKRIWFVAKRSWTCFPAPNRLFFFHLLFISPMNMLFRGVAPPLHNLEKCGKWTHFIKKGIKKSAPAKKASADFQRVFSQKWVFQFLAEAMTQLAEASYKQSNELGKSTMGIQISIEKSFPQYSNFPSKQNITRFIF